MKIRYFEDTDTAYVELSAGEPVETRAISDDVYLDMDATGRVVSMTLEHASTHADIATLSFERIAAGTPTAR